MNNFFNRFILDITVSIIDFLYRGRDYQRFWVLEEIARAPYFAFLSVLAVLHPASHTMTEKLLPM